MRFVHWILKRTAIKRHRALLLAKVVVMASNLNSVKLCDVCQEIKPSSDEHHAWPRHLGGAHGPVVNICPTCHQTIHRSINNPALRDAFLSGLTPLGRKVAEYLYTVIALAEASGIKSERMEVNFEIDRSVYAELKNLARDYGVPEKTLIEKILLRALGKGV